MFKWWNLTASQGFHSSIFSNMFIFIKCISYIIQHFQHVPICFDIFHFFPIFSTSNILQDVSIIFREFPTLSTIFHSFFHGFPMLLALIGRLHPWCDAVLRWRHAANQASQERSLRLERMREFQERFWWWSEIFSDKNLADSWYIYIYTVYCIYLSYIHNIIYIKDDKYDKYDTYDKYDKYDKYYKHDIWSYDIWHRTLVIGAWEYGISPNKFEVHSWDGFPARHVWLPECTCISGWWFQTSQWLIVVNGGW